MCRTITILLENATINDKERLMDYCKEHGLCFNHRYSRKHNLCNKLEDNQEDVTDLWYFSIDGCTNDYDKLNEHMNNRLVLTNFAEFGNIADKDNEFMRQLQDCVFSCRDLIEKDIVVNRKFCEFIKTIDDVNVLKSFVKMYGCHFTDFQKKLAQNRIDVLNHERYHFEEEMVEAFKSLDCDVAQLREKTGMTRREFANYFEIPYRTVEDWEKKKSSCSTYLFSLMVYRLKIEQKME